MTRYRLHYFPESGNSYKLALMLTLCGETFEPVWTDFGDGVTRTKEWRATVNEMGEIPVLEEDGERLTQTAPILLRLAERYGRFGGTTDAERFDILRWLFWDNHNRLHGDLPLQPRLHAVARSGRLDLHEAPHRRLSRHPRCSSAPAPVRDRRQADDRRHLDDGLPVVPRDEAGYDLPQSHPAVAAWLARMAGLPGWKAPYDLLPGQRLHCYG